MRREASAWVGGVCEIMIGLDESQSETRRVPFYLIGYSISSGFWGCYIQVPPRFRCISSSKITCRC